MDKNTISSKLKNFIEAECEISIMSADEALDIDSFNMMLIITFVDSDLGVHLDMDKLNFDAFTSLNTLTDLVVGETAVAAA